MSENGGETAGVEEVPKEGKPPMGRTAKGTFLPGNPGPGRPKSVKKVLVGESHDLLTAMQHVLTQPASKDWTYQQVELREWLKTARGAFMTKYTALAEQATPSWDGKGACPTCGREPVKLDPKSRELQAMCQKLLARIQGGEE